MKNIHFKKNTRSFFEGWYLKHNNGEKTIAFIPGINFDKDGKPDAFIQIITDKNSYVANYSSNDFYAAKKKFDVKIGDSSFNKDGINININLPDFKCSGKIEYGKFTPLKYDIMGPFCILPNLECSHGILSLAHVINGSLSINGQETNFDNGYGYIEKDWGRSFPKEYTWLHFRESGSLNSVMVSVADIPFMGRTFKGLIAVVYENGKQYRLATYNGGRIVENSDGGLVIKKRRYLLKIFFSNEKGHALKAPVAGEMNRTVFERLSGQMKIEFYKGNKCIFERASNRASYEKVLNDSI